MTCCQGEAEAGRTANPGMRLETDGLAFGPEAQSAKNGAATRSVCVLALSAIVDDPRVRRQAEAFHRAGWKVVAVGLPGGRSPRPDWRIADDDDDAARAPSAAGAVALLEASSARLPVPLMARLRRAHRFLNDELEERLVCRQTRRSSGPGPGQRRASNMLVDGLLGLVRSPLWPPRSLSWLLLGSLGQARRSLGRARYAFRLLAVRASPSFAAQLFWSYSDNILGIYRRAALIDADVWLANDWTMLPVAARLAREKGGIYGYDTHEFAREEYAEKWRWRFWHRPLVCAVEAADIGGADVVSGVSAGITEELDQVYRLRRRTLVVRNTPPFTQVGFRPTGQSIRMLYHGIVAPGRGLEAAIDSVRLWPPQFSLTIRGPGDAAYIAGLRQRIGERGIEQRAHLVPPVPMTALVREASLFDVGFFALPGTSQHNRFALPNKFFEYVMAGLALCVSDLPEMGRLLRQYDLGIAIAAVDPPAIAAAIAGFTPRRIDCYKRNALAAASELCWEKEAAELVAAYEAALQRKSS